MEYIITDSTGGAISREEQESVSSCVDMIASTQRGTMPFMRSMGLEQVIPRDNLPTTLDDYSDDLMEQVDEWDERVTAIDVSWEDNNRTKVVLEYGESE